MKAAIHPKYEEVVVTCSCGHTFKTGSTLGRKDLHLEICSQCHPFYTGTQKLVDTSGRVEKFIVDFVGQQGKDRIAAFRRLKQRRARHRCALGVHFHLVAGGLEQVES